MQIRIDYLVFYLHFILGVELRFVNS